MLLSSLYHNYYRLYNARPAMGQYDRNKDGYVYLTFSEMFDLVKLFGSGLQKLMLNRGCSGSMVSMCSISRLEWYLTDVACLLLGIPTVSPRYRSNTNYLAPSKRIRPLLYQDARVQNI